MAGKFIVIESNDNSGKTTICNKLVSRIDNAIYFKFPNRSGFHGKIINDYLNKKIELENESIFSLFLENMEAETNKLLQLMKSGKNIICDRYFFSLLVYHAYNTNNFDSIKNNINLTKNMIVPDFVFLINGFFKKEDINERYDSTKEIYNIFYNWFSNSSFNYNYKIIDNKYPLQSGEYDNMINNIIEIINNV